MYRMGEFEFEQYRTSEARLSALLERQAVEIQQAYQDVHPTRVRFDYDLGRLSSESASVEEHAIYIADIKVDHKRHRAYWEQRMAVFKEALTYLDDKEHEIYKNAQNLVFNYEEYNEVLDRLHDLVEDIVSMIPELRRDRHAAPVDVMELDEWDEMVDKMSDRELLQDYWDKDELDLAVVD